MNPNSMTCDTPEALRFFATASKPAASEWMRNAAEEIERIRISDEERTALNGMAAYFDIRGNATWSKLLRSLLERTK